MYGILSVIFIVILSFTHYELSTYFQSPYLINKVNLIKHIATSDLQIFATCTNKQTLTDNPFIDLKIMSQNSLTFVVIFQSNPLLECKEITYALDFSDFNQKSDKIQFEKIMMLKALTGKTQIIKLEKGQYFEIKNDKQFFLIMTVKQKQQIEISEDITISLQMQNPNYLQQVLKCVFWFSWFNLIGISLISYYRKNVFNQRVQISTSIAILIYLICISFTSKPSLLILQQQLKTVMLAFILLICVKLKLNLPEIILIVFLAIVNQFTIDSDINTQVKWIVFVANLFNLSNIYLGLNYEAAHFSVFSFLIQYGLMNPIVHIINPLALSFILVNLTFGPTIYELLQLRQNVTIQVKKTQQKLQSYEISEYDHLFVS